MRERGRGCARGEEAKCARACKGGGLWQRGGETGEKLPPKLEKKWSLGDLEHATFDGGRGQDDRGRMTKEGGMEMREAHRKSINSLPSKDAVKLLYVCTALGRPRTEAAAVLEGDRRK